MISYETNIITIEGAELLRKSKEQNKKVEIHKAAFLPFPISRDVAASLKYTNFVGSEWTQYLPELDNIEFVSGQGSNLEICTKAASEDNLFVKSIVLFAKLYNEDSGDVAFAVISDDNSVVELSETKIKVQLNASAKDFYSFGKDDEAELIENIEKYTINDEGEAVSGLQFTLSKEGEDDITISRNKVVLSCELIDGALVFTTGNGDLFSISGENVTIEKSTLYPLTEIEVLFGVKWDSSNSEWTAKNLYPGYNYGRSGIINEHDKNLLVALGLISIELNSDGAPYGYAATTDKTLYTIEIMKVYSDLGETEIPIDTFSASLEYNTKIDGTTYYMPGIENSANGTNVKSWLCRITKNEPVPPTPTPTKETAYLSNRFDNTEVSSQDVTFYSIYVPKGTPPYDYAETIKGDGGKVYSLTGVFQKDGTPVTYTDYHFFISGEDLALEVSFELSYNTVCYIEYTEE